MMFTAAVVVLINFVSCISEEPPWEVMPPDHPSFQHLTFLEVLHVEQGSERRVEPKTDTILRRMPSLANLAVQGPHIILQALMGFELPDALKSKYEDDATLGSGTFGVTFLATRKADNQKVAVKVFKDEKNLWATPATCKSAQCKGMVASSALECLDTQGIHEADNLDTEASDHVVKCLYDGITGQTVQSQPYYIEMSYAGRDDVDKWWGKKLKQNLDDALYVQHLKSVSKGVYLGLRFMAESKTANKWVHMDLKPQNMVINEDTGETVIVDMGTVRCKGSLCPEGLAGTTPVFRPPEVSHLSLFQPAVGWHEPVWSFDVHSAALSILGMATDGNSGLRMPGGVSLFAVPVLPFLLTNGVQNSMANWATVKKVVDCASALATPHTQEFFNALLQCTGDVSIEHYKKLFDERLEAIRKATGNERKAAWARLVHCRTSKTPLTTLYTLPDLKATQVPKFFWTLVDDWMTTGFDEVLLKALSTEPTERPEPSKILEAQWFNADAPKVSGTSVEFTCPDFAASQAYYQMCAGCVTAILSIVSCCVCCGGTCGTCCCQIPAWKWASVWGGILVVASPFSAFFLMEGIVLFCLFLLLMVPLGLAMICLQFAGEGSRREEKKVKLGIIGLSAVAALACSLCLFNPATAVNFIPPDLKSSTNVPVGGRLWIWAILASSLLAQARMACLYGVIAGISVMMRSDSDARDVSTGSTVELGAV
ncbi:SAMS2 [Symbiodinium sp. CCMP2456]|nr:SAMS2 [Symbiodinium sp. CCMP2456]